jgi:hypothetical protein
MDHVPLSPITTMTLAESRLAEQAWLRQTSFTQRRHVMKYIRRGEVHPDPVLAQRCYRWAKGEAQFSAFRATRAGFWTVLGTFWVPGLAQSVFSLRTARRIVEISERHMASADTRPASERQ